MTPTNLSAESFERAVTSDGIVVPGLDVGAGDTLADNSALRTKQRLTAPLAALDSTEGAS